MSASNKKKLRKELNAAMLTEKQQKAQTEAKQTKKLTIAFAVVMIAIVAVFAVTQVIGIIDRSGLVEKSTIALTVDDHKLNSVEMNYYFFDALDSQVNQYGQYASYYFQLMGLDLTKSLSSQVRDAETGETWADFYWDSAVTNATFDCKMFDLAQADPDFTLPEDMQSAIDLQMQYLDTEASSNYFSDSVAYLQAKYGPGSSLASYKEYVTRSVTAYAYYNAHAESLDYDATAIKAYNDEHYFDFTAYNYASYTISYSSFLPEGVTTTDATAEQKDAAREAAKNAALALLTNTTTEKLDMAIKALPFNKDKTSNVASTKNEEVAHTSLTEEQAEWFSSADRKSGDTKLFPNTVKSKDADGNEIETTDSYLIVMFQSREDYKQPLANVRHLLVKFEGGTTDSQGKVTYSDYELLSAKLEAEGYLNEYKNGDMTEESFIALVKAHSDDTSAETGGLFEDITPASNYVANFLNWSIDPDREKGDVEVIETEFGYHVMYYVGDDELTYRDYMIKNTLLNQDMEKWETEQTDAAVVTEGSTDRINFGLIYAAG